ncbi:hypothetical protein [Saccharopolyspora sp. NPDC049426]
MSPCLIRVVSRPVAITRAQHLAVTERAVLAGDRRREGGLTER